jgi:hypothetical protein
VLTDGLKFYIDAADYASWPGERSLAGAWADYSSNQAHYDVVGDNGVILLGTSTSWIGRFEVTPTATGNHTLMFDYWADAQTTMVFNNDGIMDNDYTGTLTAETYKKTHSVTVNHTATGAMYHYFRNNASGTKVYIDNVRFFKESGWNDISGGGTDTTLNGTPVFNNTNDPPIYYLTFDGTDDYAQAPQGFQIGNVRQKTVEAWVGDWTSGTLLSMTDHNNNYKWQQHGIGSSQLMTGSGYGTRYHFASTYTASGWHHWVDVCDEDLTATNRVKRYIDGVPISTTSQSTDDGSSFYDGTDLYLQVGAMNYGSGAADFFTGKIAIVRIYDSALTHAQAKQNFNAERNRFGV